MSAPMQIDKDRVVYFHYRMSEAGADFLEASEPDQPMAYLHGHGNLMPALERALDGRQAGDKIEVTLQPGEAYGMPRPDAQQRVPIKHLVNTGARAAARLRPGMAVKINTADGPRDARIIKVGKFNVDVDTNHPLAGKALTFAIEVMEVRQATVEELAHGHVHGAGGHHH